MQSASDKIIKITGYYDFCLYPKQPNIIGTENHSYGVVKFEVLEVLEGNPIIGKDETVTITGEYYEPLKKGVVYTLLAKETTHPTYGLQYNLMYIGEQIDLNTVINQKAFLSVFLTDNQIDELYKVYKNPLAIIENHDIQSLTKVHGIGDYIANCIIERYENNKDLSSIYVELSDYGFTPAFIRRLVKAYRSSTAIIKAIKEHPYELIQTVDGIGFKRADEIALKGGLSPRSIERIEAYISFYLEEEATNNGNSYVTAGELLTNIYSFFGGKDNISEEVYNEAGEKIGSNISIAIKNLQDKHLLVVEQGENKSRRRVYLTYYYNLEKEIASHLKRLLDSENQFDYSNWEEDIKELEERQGFVFDEAQRDGIKLGLDNQVCLITGGGGCVDADTEFFTGEQWKRIADYQEGDKVLQYCQDGTATLVDPLKYIKLPSDNLWHFETKYGINQTLCDEHNIIYWTPEGVQKECAIQDIIDQQKNSYSGWRGRIKTSFIYDGKGIDLSDAQIKLMCAVICDGSFQSQRVNNKWCRFRIKKDHKKQKLIELFTECNLEYKERKSDAEDYTNFYCYAPIRTKQFDSYWYGCNNHQLQVICDNILFWGGNESATKKGTARKSFSTSIEETANFIQFAFTAIGYKATIFQKDCSGEKYFSCGKWYTRKSKEYTILITNRSFVGINHSNYEGQCKTMPQQVPTVDGYKYCFQVPSHMLVLRREGSIFITGNCGKSSLVSGILAALKSYSFAQCALSGKASARLQEVTGHEGMTIHRLLGYNPRLGFTYNEDNPLPYSVIVLDEVSMVGGEIFLNLLKAIPNGTKLICLGDNGQLESIGALNVASDMLHSSLIPTVVLTKIHRQAAKSGIITSANEIRNQRQLFSSSYEGEEVLGELQDMTFDLSTDKTDTRERVMDKFEQWYHQDPVNEDIMKIQVIVPIKERGDACVYNLNQDIQAIVNPIKPRETTITCGSTAKPYTIHYNDKVMCIKNNYNTVNIDGVTSPIFNGWTGIVKKINSDGVVVDFPLGDGRIFIPYKEALSDLILGYASTVHKMQGSSAPVIITALDYTTPPSMLTCQLLYTAITRAEKHCIVVGNSGAIYKATSNNFVSQKRTFLQEFLEEKD